MIKKLTGFLDYGLFAEIALVIFAVVFVAIIVRTLLIRSEISEEQARIVLGETTPTHKILRANSTEEQKS